MVFSGGEPLLYPALGRILEYYKQHVPARVVITNGLLLSEGRRRDLSHAGATGFAFSIDSVSPERYFAARGWRSEQLARVLANLRAASNAAKGEELEVGVNAVVTRANAIWESVCELLDLATSLNLTCVKFQPLFDNGFLGRSAPWLALDSRSVADLEEIASGIDGHVGVATNPAGFWRDLAVLVAGRPLDPLQCGLGGGTVLLARGRLARCYWVPDADLTFSSVGRGEVEGSALRLEAAKPQCNVDARCFCMQSMAHEWSIQT